MTEGSGKARGDAQCACITIRLDAESWPDELLRPVARLAAAMQARLNGIFVEDENLLSLSHYSFAREVSFSGRVSSFDSSAMLRAMKSHASAARQVLERVALEAELQWHFDVARGYALEAMRSAARTGDLLVIRASSLWPMAYGAGRMLLIVPGAIGAAEDIVAAAQRIGVRLAVVNAAQLGEDHPGARLALMADCPVLVLDGAAGGGR